MKNCRFGPMRKQPIAEGCIWRSPLRFARHAHCKEAVCAQWKLALEKRIYWVRKRIFQTSQKETRPIYAKRVCFGKYCLRYVSGRAEIERSPAGCRRKLSCNGKVAPAGINPSRDSHAGEAHVEVRPAGDAARNEYIGSCVSTMQ